MKKLFFFLLLVMLVPSALASKSSLPVSSVQESAEDQATMSLGVFRFSLLPQWEKISESTDDLVTAYYFQNTASGPDNTLRILTVKSNNTYTDSHSLELFYESVVDGMGVINAYGSVYTINGGTGYYWGGSIPVSDTETARISGALYCHDNDLLVITYTDSECSIKSLWMAVKEIADSVVVDDRPTSASEECANATYQAEELHFSICGTYMLHADDSDYIVIGIDWTNDSDKPIMFWSSLSIEAYQNGIEIDSHAPYDFEKNDWVKVLPGYGTTSYACFPINGNGEVVFVIDDYIDISNKFEDVYITVNPDELPEI